MGEFDIEIEIRKPIDLVFRYLADVENTPHWYSAVRSARLIEGPGPGLGARYQIVRELLQGRVEDIVEVLEFEPPRRFSFGTRAGATPFRYQYVLEDLQKTTLVRLRGEIAVSGAARLLAPLATQAFRRGMAANLDTLKRILEAG